MSSTILQGLSSFAGKNIRIQSQGKAPQSNLGKLLNECVEVLLKKKSAEEICLDSTTPDFSQKRPRKVVKLPPSISLVETKPTGSFLQEQKSCDLAPLTQSIKNVMHDIFEPPPPPPSPIRLSIHSLNTQKDLPIFEPPPPPPSQIKSPIATPPLPSLSFAKASAKEKVDFSDNTQQMCLSEIDLSTIHSQEGIFSLLSGECPRRLFFAFGIDVARVAKQILASSDTCGVCQESFELVVCNGQPDIKKWEIKKSLRSVILLLDNHGSDTEFKAQLLSLVSHFLDQNLVVKIAFPRTEKVQEKRSFQEVLLQKNGLSRCAKVLRKAVLIEGIFDLEPLDQPLQTVIQKTIEKRESALNSSSKEPIEHRVNAAINIYNKAEPIGAGNIVAVNLWMRGITGPIPPTFRAAMIPHPDWPEERNRQMLSSQDKRTGLLSRLKDTFSLENKIIAYDDQYWLVTSDVRWKDAKQQDVITTLSLKNYRDAITITIVGNEVQINQNTIATPDATILVCDFKRYARVIPYYNKQGELTGIERAFLGPNAGKPELQKKPGGLWKSKLARGVTCGSLTRLYGEKEAECMVLGEGAENVLTALDVLRKSPSTSNFLKLVMENTRLVKANCQFVASLGVNDLVRVPLEESVRTVILLADNDGYNMETKQTLIDTVDRFLSKGLKVKISLAIAESLGKKKDINDVLLEKGVSAVEEMLCQTVEITSKEDLGSPAEPLQLNFLRLSLQQQLQQAPKEKQPFLLFSLGNVHAQLSKKEKALICYQKALLDAEKPLRMQILDALGSLWLDIGEHDLALHTYEKSLQEKVRWYQTTEHSEIASSLIGIGNVYTEKNAFETALSYFVTSSSIKARWWKSDAHVDLFSSFYGFGNLYFKQKKYDLAIFNFEKCIQLKQKEFGSEIHPSIAKIAEEIGDAYYKNGQYREAIDSYKRTLEIFQKLFCSERYRPDEEVLTKIAKASFLQNDILQSLEYFGKSFHVNKQTASPRALKRLLDRASQLQTLSKKTEKKSDPLPPKKSQIEAKVLSLAILKERAKRTKQIALDIEMTGSNLSIDRITEIGCIALSNFEKTGEKFQAYVNPGRNVRPEAHRITGLTQRFLQKFPPFTDVAKDFLRFIQDSDLIIHAADSDLDFLAYEFKRGGIEYDVRKKHEIIDTLTIAKQLYPNQKNSLDALNARLNINRPRPQHGALLDAEILADVYRKFSL